MKKMIFTAGAAIIALGTAAYAAPGAEQARNQPTTLAAAQELAATMFERMDANKDGQVNAADREARQNARFARMDTNGDGAINRTEFAARGDKAQRDGERMGQRSPRDRGAHHGRGGRMMPRMADADKDGTITRAEFDASVKQHFARSDTNGDGTITPAERKAAHENMRQMQKQQRQQSAD